MVLSSLMGIKEPPPGKGWEPWRGREAVASYTIALHRKYVNNNHMASYANLKKEVISAFESLYNVDLAFDYAKIKKDDRVKMLGDEDFLEEIAHKKADFLVKQHKVVKKLIADAENDPEDKNSAQTLLKSLEMRQKMIDEQVTEADESNALNIFFLPLTKKDYEAMLTAEIFTPEHEAEKAFDD